MRKFLRFVRQALATFVIVAGAVLLLLGVVVPRVAGATNYAVLANSMAPRYPLGTLMVVRPSDTISVGDIITYQVSPDDPMVTSHRVVGISRTIGGEPRFTVKGDANSVPDPSQVRPEQVRGKLMYAIPYAGFLLVGVHNGQQYASGIAAGLLGVYAIWQIVRAVSEKQKSRRGLDNSAGPAIEAGAVLDGSNSLPEVVALRLAPYVAPILLPPEQPPVEQVTPQPRSRAERRSLAQTNPTNNSEFSLVS